MDDAQTSPLDQVHIAQPCPMASALARGEAADRRYCDQCEKHVVNLGALTRQQAEAEVRRARAQQTQLCVRIVRDVETGAVLTRDDLPVLTERLSQSRPAGVAAALALALLQWSCTGETEPQSSEAATTTQDGTEQVVGTTRTDGATLSEEEARLLLELGGYMSE